MKISEKQKQKIEELAKKYHLKLILLFGSRVSEKFLNKESDFDVAYLPEKKLSFDNEIDINLQFTYIFRHDRVDTVNIKRSPPLLMYGIFRECQILFKKDDMVFPTYRVYAFKKFVEAKPLFDAMASRLKKYDI